MRQTYLLTPWTMFLANSNPDPLLRPPRHVTARRCAKQILKSLMRLPLKKSASAKTLVRRLRKCRYGGTIGHRSRETPVRLRSRERAASQRRTGKHGRLFLHAETRRQDSGHESRARRTSYARASGKFIRQVL